MTAALVLSAGGARGAYEAGVLLGLATHVGLPFRIVTGTSAGAINAGHLVAHAHEAPVEAMDELVRFWAELRGRYLPTRFMPWPCFRGPPGGQRR
jgi:NTE family protein